MALDVSTSRALRTTDELAGLIQAIAKAGKHDETNWLELKSSLELSAAEAKFKIAKAILGFSNRSVGAAARYFEGCAYVVIGADQDGLHGVAEVDVASLEQSLAPYLGTGDDAPRWSCRYVEIDRRSVLVVTVEAPRPGDRIRTIRKEFGGFKPGTIFIRGQAKTEVATPDDVRMLEDRLTHGLGLPEMILEASAAVSHSGIVLLADYTDVAEVDAWTARRRAELLAELPAPAHQQPPNSAASILAAAASAGRPSARERYSEKVESYLLRCRAKLPLAIVRSIVTSEHNKVSVRVSNPSPISASAVRLVVAVPRSLASVHDVAPQDSELPEPPNWSELISPFPRIPTPIQFDIDAMKFGPRGFPGEVSLHVEDDITHVVWSFGDLHAGQFENGDPVTFVPVTSGPIRLDWVATASNRHGQQIGTFQLDVIENSRWGFG